MTRPQKARLARAESASGGGAMRRSAMAWLALAAVTRRLVLAAATRTLALAAACGREDAGAAQ